MTRKEISEVVDEARRVREQNTADSLPTNIDRMLRSVRDDYDRQIALKEIDDCGWKNISYGSDWRLYIPMEIREEWKSLSIESRIVAYCMALREVYSEPE